MTRGKPQTPPSAAVHRAEHVFRLVERLRLSWLLAHLPPTAVWASYVFVNSFATIGLLAVVGIPDAQSVCFLSTTWRYTQVDEERERAQVTAIPERLQGKSQGGVQ